MDDFLNIISAVNDETRVLILKFLCKHGEACVCELQQSLNMIQSRLSRHLKILKMAGFLQVRREGGWAYYKIQAPIDNLRQALLTEINKINVKLPKKKTLCKT
ncbi:MAG: metalloregulator ArsR/SmtB family transcription factor [Candidatus Magnetoovum sp. WYHC-5]|nr:metalloregulator ArsR/SmtB family transcription factor [Candidatus Magnetoovum sp. WYHC-5]